MISGILSPLPHRFVMHRRVLFLPLHLEAKCIVVVNYQDAILTRLVHSATEFDLRAQKEIILLIYILLDFHGH